MMRRLFNWLNADPDTGLPPGNPQPVLIETRYGIPIAPKVNDPQARGEEEHDGTNA